MAERFKPVLQIVKHFRKLWNKCTFWKHFLRIKQNDISTKKANSITWKTFTRQIMSDETNVHNPNNQKGTSQIWVWNGSSIVLINTVIDWPQAKENHSNRLVFAMKKAEKDSVALHLNPLATLITGIDLLSLYQTQIWKASSRLEAICKFASELVLDLFKKYKLKILNK